MSLKYESFSVFGTLHPKAGLVPSFPHQLGTLCPASIWYAPSRISLERSIPHLYRVCRARRRRGLHTRHRQSRLQSRYYPPIFLLFVVQIVGLDGGRQTWLLFCWKANLVRSTPHQLGTLYPHQFGTFHPASIWYALSLISWVRPIPHL